MRGWINYFSGGNACIHVYEEEICFKLPWAKIKSGKQKVFNEIIEVYDSKEEISHTKSFSIVETFYNDEMPSNMLDKSAEKTEEKGIFFPVLSCVLMISSIEQFELIELF